MTALDSVVEHKDEGILLSAPVIMELIEAVHEKGCTFRFRARGHSMTPAIRDGDVITISHLGDLPVGRGAVLAFRHPERPQMLVHRVLRARGDNYFSKGDNCPEADGWIKAENILGIVMRVERQGKNIFWPDRRHAWARLYFILYALWLLLPSFLVRAYRSLKARITKT